jgi:PAS domain S-box-containing protein
MKTATDTNVTHILLIEDDKAHQDLVLRAFRDDPEQYRLSVAANLREARLITERDLPDLILADWVLPDGKGLEILMRRDGAVTIPLIIMTSYGDEHLAVQIMKSGAIDYVVKSATMFAELPRIIKRALHDWENIHERKRAEEAVQDTHKRLGDILSFLPDAVLAIDNDGRVIAWNDAIARMTGVPAAEMLGKGNHEYSIPFYGERRPILIDLVIIDDTDIETKYDFIQRDGDRITTETFIPTIFGGKGAYLWGTATPLYDTAGNRTGAIEVIRDITERKQAEEKLRESRDILSYAFYKSPLIKTLSDLSTGKYLEVNDSFCRVSKFSREEVIGKTAIELGWISKDERLRMMQEVQQAGWVNGIELPLRSKNGQNIIARYWGTILHTPQGDKLLSTAEDITERKRAEIALRESEERFRTLLQNVPSVAVQGYSMDGTTLYWNAASERVYGYSQEEALGKNLLDLIIPPEMRSDVRDAIRDMAETGHPIPSAELSLMKKGGLPISVYSSHAIVRKSDGSSELFCIDVDMTERKRAEEALQESEKKYRFLIDNVRDVVWQTLPDLTFTYVSPSVESRTGYSPSEVTGTSLLDLLTESSARVVRERLRKRMEEFSHGSRDLATVFEIELIRKDGGTRWFEASANAIIGPQGSLDGFQGISRDISERKMVETALTESEERYRGLMNHLPDYVIVHRDGILLYVNPSAAARMGYDQETLVGRPILPLIDPAYHSTIQKAIAQRMEGEDLPSYEIKIVTKNGALRTVLVNGVMIQYGGGPASLNVLTDITLLKEAEETRKANEFRLDSAMEIGSLAWWEMDLPDGTVRFDDRKATMLGYPPEKFRHYTDFTQILHPDDDKPTMQAMKEHLEGIEARYHADYRIRTSDGTYRWFRDVGGITRRHADGSPAPCRRVPGNGYGNSHGYFGRQACR